MSSEAPLISRGISPLLPICVFNFSVTKKSFVQLIAGETLRRATGKLGVFGTYTVAFHSPICHFFRVRNSFIAYCLRTLKIYFNSTLYPFLLGKRSSQMEEAVRIQSEGLILGIYSSTSQRPKLFKLCALTRILCPCNYPFNLNYLHLQGSAIFV